MRVRTRLRTPNAYPSRVRRRLMPLSRLKNITALASGMIIQPPLSRSDNASG